jgi:hypothetical protein
VQKQLQMVLRSNVLERPAPLDHQVARARRVARREVESQVDR